VSRPAATASAGERARPLTKDAVVDAALRIVEDAGVDALTMRRLADELGAAVTAIYWHVGNRDALLDELVARILAELGAVRGTGSDPPERIASLARSLRHKLLARPHLVGLAHQRGKTGAMFTPVQAALARELAALGITGAPAALTLRAIEHHVVASVVLERTAARGPAQGSTDPGAWPDGTADPELVAALAAPADRDAVFEYGLGALVASLRQLANG
jgi:TetR/AcrR family transcriptional regulator, tetracycline repressor protein